MSDALSHSIAAYGPAYAQLHSPAGPQLSCLPFHTCMVPFYQDTLNPYTHELSLALFTVCLLLPSKAETVSSSA